jgi:hypothetical protein
LLGSGGEGGGLAHFVHMCMCVHVCGGMCRVDVWMHGSSFRSCNA